MGDESKSTGVSSSFGQRNISDEKLKGLSPLVRAVLWRRSFRVYDGRPVSSDVLDRIEQAACHAPSVFGARSGWVELIRDPKRVRDLLLAITGGVVGKGNWWIRSAQPAAFLVALGDEATSLRIGDRWMYNVDIALAGEAAVLAAAAEGVGSCWMAAIDERKLCHQLGLSPTGRIPAVIALGYPRSTAARNLAGMWDRLAHRLVSSRRKPPEAIHFLEQTDSSTKLAPVHLEDERLQGRGKSIQDLVADLVPSRTLDGTSIDDRILSWLLETVRQAPTADNSQIWRLLFLRKPERIREVLDAAADGRDDLAALSESHPGALVVAAATKFFISHRTAEQPFYLIDVPIGLMHLLLAARDFDLSFNVLWDFNDAAVSNCAGLGDHRIVALILLGTEGEMGGSEPWVQLRRGHAG